MGVPKFFRFISERYPSINKIIKEHEIPQYDNLYLDMNCIIHTCSHPTDSDVYFRIGKKEFSDENILQNVSRYVELIFRIVKPTELMFLAFDGVAPRAKMNQQRANRFRVTKDINNKSVVEREMLDDTDTLFDSNCITPGTIFMTELIDHMRHFVAYKVSMDPLWQKCKIILSGSEVPGEGEHKIMQFIRFNKTQANYNPNTRHCLYSLDADLIILGLSTHEPHFSLLRENVTFGKTKTMLTPEESDFHLLHLSLVREYLEYEFASIKPQLKFKFDLEKIIDDWVLIVFLVGNDFIPQLPYLHIVNGALPLLYSVYIKVLPTLDGYLNEAGELHVSRFEKYMRNLSHIETKMLELIKSTGICYIQDADMNVIKRDFEGLCLKPENNEANNLENSIIVLNYSANKINVTELKSKDHLCFEVQKEHYYRNKLKFSDISESLIYTLVEQYIKAIQWTLSYYYHGCCSWSWYFPYHYAPLISDIRELQNVNFKFDMAKPFLPLQHLLAVLPPENSHLLPIPLRSLLTNSKSPIIDFYPKEFDVDLNGKSNDWEAIVLIPFIDENRLISAMEPYNTSLNLKERKRNENGLTCVYTYTKTHLGQYPVDTLFDSFVNHAQMEHINAEDMFTPKNKLVKGLCDNVRFDLSFPGFPTLKHVLHIFGIEMAETKNTFNHLIKFERIILNVSPKPTSYLQEIAKQFLGRTVYINWPHLQQAYVIGVTDLKDKIVLENFWKKYNADNLKCDKVSDYVRSNLERDEALINEKYRKCFGINIGETKVLVYVFPIMGKRYVCGNLGKVQLLTKWSTLSITFPYQLIVREVQLFKVDFTLYKSITDIFTVSHTCFMIGYPHYGSIGKITKGVHLRQHHVAVALNVTAEPDFTSTEEDYFATKINYMSCNSIAKTLNINSILISRITGSLIVTEGPNDFYGSKYYDIGLRMKFPKQEKELLGYTKKKNDSWFYSKKAVQLIKIYSEKFPDIFGYMSKNTTSSTFTVSDLFPKGLSELNLVKSWLAEQKASYTTFLECGTKYLGSGGVPKLEKFVCNYLSKQPQSMTVEIEVSPQVLFRPGTIVGLVPPDVKAQHKLLDRIICIRENFTVPLGLKGTIIGIQEKEVKWKNIYEVLFDNSFTAGLTLYESSEHKCYRLTVADFVNISFGKNYACAIPTDEASKSSVTISRPTQVCRDNLKNKRTKSDNPAINVPSTNIKIKPTKTVNASANIPSNNTNKKKPFKKVSSKKNPAQSQLNETSRKRHSNSNKEIQEGK